MPLSVNRNRTHRGSVLAEGVVALGLVIAGAVGGTLLLVNAGVATYYKEKLGFIDNQAAIYAANQANLGLNSDQVQAQTETFVNDLLRATGMPESEDITTTVDADKVTVATRLANISVIGNGTILPAFVSVQDLSVYKRDRALFPVVIDCNDGNSGRLYVAAYCVQAPVLSPTVAATITGGPSVGTKPAKIFGKGIFSAGYYAAYPAGTPSPAP